MLRDIYKKKPKQVIELETYLSCDWQVYSKCSHCGWEQRFDYVLGNPKEALDVQCYKCGKKDNDIIRHIIQTEYICRECQHYEENVPVLDISELKCRKCSSSHLSLLKYYVFPEFPKTFGEVLNVSGEDDWGTSVSSDVKKIVQLLQCSSLQSDFSMQFLPYIKLCEHLRMSSYKDHKDVSEILNMEGNLLRDYFRRTGDIEIGREALKTFEESANLIDESINKALIDHNIAMTCYSIISRFKLPVVQTYFDFDVRIKGLEYARKALNFFEKSNTKEIQNINVQIARIHHLIGDTLKIYPFTYEDLVEAEKHYDIALQEKSMPSTLIRGIHEGKSMVLSYMKQYGSVSDKEIESGLKKAARYDEKNRTYSEKLTSLLNLSQHYLSKGKINKAKNELELAIALGLFEIERTTDVNSLEHKVKEYEPAFNYLFNVYVKLNSPLKALCVLEKIRAATLNSHIDKSKQKLTKVQAEKNIKHMFSMLMGGGSEFSRIKKLKLDVKSMCNSIESFYEQNINSTALCYLNIVSGVFSAVLVYWSNKKQRIELFAKDWTLSVKEKETFIKIVPKLSEADSFREKRLTMLCELGLSIINTELIQILNNNLITSIGFSIPSAMNVIPFEALRIDFRNKAILGDKFSVYHVPSIETASLLAKPRLKQRFNRVLIVPYRGKDLPATKLEMNQIKKIKNLEVNVFSGRDHSKDLLIKEMVKEYDYIHFICHGIMDPINPDRSALILDSSLGDSPRLYAEEIANVNFTNNPVITLSACSSLATAIDNYNSLRGLTGSFLEAGANAIIGSKWEVFDDFGKDFMIAFYTRIAKKQKSESVFTCFNDTQKAFKNKYPIEDWASFSYLGIIN